MIDILKFIADHSGMNLADALKEAYEQGKRDAQSERKKDDINYSAEERKTGKWNFIGNQMFECSECGTCYTQSQFYQMRVRISDTEFPKFCPNCGADMRGEQDE